MMKTISKILLALACGTLGSVALADVTLYGQIRGGVQVNKTKYNDGRASSGTTTQIRDFGSRIGFKGQEQLNGSLKAIWQLEQRVDVAGGGGTVRGFGTRDSFVGLEDANLGRIRAGYFNAPIVWNDEYLNPWNYGSSELGLDYFTRGNDALTRRVAVDYRLKKGGATALLYASPSDNNLGRNNSATPNRDSAVYGAMLEYKQNGVFANTAGGYVKNGANNQSERLGSRKDGYQVMAQVGVDKGPWLAGVGYQYARNVDGASAFRANAFDGATGATTHSVERAQEVIGTVAYKLDNGLRLKGSVGYGFDIQAIQTDAAGVTDKVKAGGNGKYAQAVLGASYHLSKRTELMAQAGYLQTGKGDQKIQSTGGLAAIRHRF